MEHAELLTLEENGILSVVGDLDVVKILLELSAGQKRFSDFNLKVSSKTLSKKLKLLEKHGIVTRTAYAEIPPRVEYTLTVKGQELISILEGILQWESEWLQPDLESSQ